jgi:DNA repair protein RadC
MSVASPREIFVEALRYEACSVCLLHNHPSGDPTPSREDIYATKRIRDAGRLLGIQLIDHIVIGDKCYVSLREQGYL